MPPFYGEPTREERMTAWRRMSGVLGTAVLATGLLAGHGAEAKDKYKIYLSMSYIGNDWQGEAANMVKAMAASKDLADKVDLQVQVAGPNAQRQIQQINAMVQAGAKAIVVYPISPTALNGAVKNACDKGVMVIAYDAAITEPCAYNVHIDQTEAGRATAEWLAKKLDGKGNIVLITGVPGTSVDTLRTAAAREVFAKYPGIKVVQRGDRHVEPGGRPALNSPRSSPPAKWNEIDGLWTQVGCYTANTMEIEAGIASDKLKPCAGEGANGGRIQMLPAGTQVEGSNGTYKPMGAPRISYASPPYSGGLALKLAVEKLDGKDVPKGHRPAASPRHQRDDQALPGGDLGGDEGRLQRLQPGSRLESGLVRLDLFGGDARARSVGRPRGPARDVRAERQS